VEGIYLVARAEADPVAVGEARAVPGRGLEGDRYHEGAGSWTNWRGITRGQDLTLVEAEAIEALGGDAGIRLDPGRVRRNVVTRGIALNQLVGRRFRVGAIECRGDRLCHPCGLLERLTQPGVRGGLAGRGGLRADVLTGGRLKVGDPVEEIT
jgi:MOSC domain-containing protein YiiM